MASAGPELRPATGRPAGEIPALNGFRAIAIWIVMLSHIGLERFVPGQFGVTLFFFLSGYLIITLLRLEFDRDGTVSLKGFYFRRAVRILPPLAFAICLAVTLSLTGVLWPLYYPGLITDALFLSNYLPLSGVPIGLWSLAVEEHFYLVFPAIALLCFTRWGPRACALFCAVACVVALGVRFIEASRLDDLTNMTFWTHTRIDSILFGAMLACWNNPVIDEGDHMPRRGLSYAMGLALLAVTFMIRDEVFRQTLRYSVQGVALFLLFNAAIRDRGLVRTVLDSSPMRHVALWSYTLYLVHSLMIHAARPYADEIGTIPAMASALLISFGLAWFAHRAIERPLHDWRRGVERSWRAKETKPAASVEAGSPAATTEHGPVPDIGAKQLGRAG